MNFENPLRDTRDLRHNTVGDEMKRLEREIAKAFADMGADMSLEDVNAFAEDCKKKEIRFTKILSEDCPEESGYHFYKGDVLFRIVPVSLVGRVFL